MAPAEGAALATRRAAAARTLDIRPLRAVTDWPAMRTCTDGRVTHSCRFRPPANPADAAGIQVLSPAAGPALLGYAHSGANRQVIGANWRQHGPLEQLDAGTRQDVIELN
jgi:hypothetical protein